jgi:hypothetical protein
LEAHANPLVLGKSKAITTGSNKRFEQGGAFFRKAKVYDYNKKRSFYVSRRAGA